MTRIGFKEIACVAFVLAVPAAALAAGPGFNCAKARAADEKAVCKSAALSRLDRQMQSMYREIQGCALMGARGANYDDQTDWLAKRKQCGVNTRCIKALYDKRLAELKPDVKWARSERKAGRCPDQ